MKFKTLRYIFTIIALAALFFGFFSFIAEDDDDSPVIANQYPDRADSYNFTAGVAEDTAIDAEMLGQLSPTGGPVSGDDLPTNEEVSKEIFNF